MIRLLLFAVLTGLAVAMDFYFEKHPVALEELNPGGEEEESCDHATIYLFSQVNHASAKLPMQRVSGRKYQDQGHVRLLQKCHQLRNHLVLKLETEIALRPLVLSYHHLIFGHYYFNYPDDDVSFSCSG